MKHRYRSFEPSVACVSLEMLLHRALLSSSRSLRLQSLRFSSSAANSASSPRPFRILGLQQVAIGSTDKGRLSNLWVNLFGLRKLGQFTSAKENVDEDILSLGSGVGAIELDIMQPLDAAKSPKVHEPALNHLGLWVDDLPAAVSWLGEQGVRFAPGGIRKGASGFDVTFIHPKGNEGKPLSGEGVLIELVQAPKAVIEHYK